MGNPFHKLCMNRSATDTPLECTASSASIYWVTRTPSRTLTTHSIEHWYRYLFRTKVKLSSLSRRGENAERDEKECGRKSGRKRRGKKVGSSIHFLPKQFTKSSMCFPHTWYKDSFFAAWYLIYNFTTHLDAPSTFFPFTLCSSWGTFTAFLSVVTQSQLIFMVFLLNELFFREIYAFRIIDNY